jgi:acyl dehydratase
MSQETQFTLEDFTPGMVFPGATTPVTAATFRHFAQMTGDDHPIHYDAEYAAQTRFGRPLAHGLLLAGLTALGATPLTRRIEDLAPVILDVGFRYHRPVHEGDTLTSEFEVTEAKRTSKGDKGTVRFAVRLRNQEGELVVEGHHLYLVHPKPAATA